MAQYGVFNIINNIADTQIWDFYALSNGTGFIKLARTNDTQDFDTSKTYTATYYNALGFETVVNGAFPVNNRRLQFDLSNFIASESSPLDVTLAVDDTPPTPTPTITNNISGTVETYNFDGVQTITVNVSATGANKRLKNPTFTYTDVNGVEKTVNLTVSVSGNDSTATATVTDFDYNYTATINGTFETVVFVSKNLSNCTISGINDYFFQSDLNTPFSITAAAVTGCQFETAPQLSFTTNGLTPIVFTFTIAQNKLTATLTADLSSYYNDFAYIQSFTINAAAETVIPYSDTYGTINVYKVTNANLESFAAQRFFTENIAPPQGNETYQMIDLANYVCSLKRLYINVGDTAANVLKCGNYDTNINVVSPLADTLTIDCGTVEIPKPNDNITDYNSEIQIFLPFIGLNSIPTDYVGKTIGLEYIANIVTANAVAKLTCNNIVFAYYECDISTDLVYKTLASLNELKNVGTLDFNMHVLKGLQPYIIVKYYTSANEKILNADCKRCVLNTITGKFTAIEITNFSSAKITNEEFEQLQRLLENGVIIEPVTEPATPQTEP